MHWFVVVRTKNNVRINERSCMAYDIFFTSPYDVATLKLSTIESSGPRATGNQETNMDACTVLSKEQCEASNRQIHAEMMATKCNWLIRQLHV